jgi:signal transduction histidine kinase
VRRAPRSDGYDKSVTDVPQLLARRVYFRVIPSIPLDSVPLYFRRYGIDGHFREGGSVLRQDGFLLSALPPPPGQRWLAGAVTAALFVAFLVVLPFRDQQWSQRDAFIPIIDSLLFLNDLITAALLYAQFSVARARGLLALAMGYLFTALIIVPHLLTFPGIFSPTGLLGANLQTTVWLYIFWHFGLPPAVIAYTVLKRQQVPETVAQDSAAAVILKSVLAVIALTLAATWLVTVGERLLPRIMLDFVRAGALWDHLAAPLILVVSLTAVALLWTRRSSVLDMWLLVVLWAWLIETVLLSMTVSRFSLVWYAGRTFGLLGSSFVLLVLLYESTTLYARLALAAGAQARERERQHLSLEVIAGSIAHELSQPLSAIAANADAGLQLLAQTPPDLAEARAALGGIATGYCRARDIIKSTRDTLRGAVQPMGPVDIAQTIQETLTILRLELHTHGVSVQLAVSPHVPLVQANKGQLLQVLVNLITNAIESMLDVKDRPRVLSISLSMCDPAHVSITIEDSGVGVDANTSRRIFDPFFTTKSRGTGLGLAISRSIIEAHGGKISASRARAHGSVFQILLPAPTVEAPNAQTLAG